MITGSVTGVFVPWVDEPLQLAWVLVVLATDPVGEHEQTRRPLSSIGLEPADP